MDRVLLATLAFIVGLLVGIFGPLQGPGQQAEQAWINPTPQATATAFALAPPRATAPQTAVPPTLVPRPTSTPVPQPAPQPGVPTAPPPVQSFTIPLRGGGSMTVNANDLESARNNVRESGNTPAD